MNETPDSLLATDEPPPFTVDNENGTSPLLIVADHAGKHFPRRLGQLGLSREKNNAIQNNGNLASIVKIITSDNPDEEVS
jgi:hypothetical protein